MTPPPRSFSGFHLFYYQKEESSLCSEFLKSLPLLGRKLVPPVLWTIMEGSRQGSSATQSAKRSAKWLALPVSFFTLWGLAQWLFQPRWSVSTVSPGLEAPRGQGLQEPGKD